MSSSTNNGSEASIEAILNSIRQTAAQDQPGEEQLADGEAGNAEVGGANAGNPYDVAPGHRSLTDSLHAAAPTAEGGDGVSTGDAPTGPDWDRPQLIIGPLADLAGEPVNSRAGSVGGTGVGSVDEHLQAAPAVQGTNADAAASPGATAANPPKEDDQVARQMVPFADTRMNRMGSASTDQGPSPSPSTTNGPVPALSAGTQPSPTVSNPTQPVAPAPVAPTSAATETPPPLGQKPASPPVGSVVHTSPPASLPADGGTALPQNAHDAAAELLRPVLRQWVGENMPRIVEKALHIELAESIKKPLGQDEEK